MGSCSTPFGINESTTRDRQRDGGRRLLLNAFRHQRINDEGLLVAGAERAVLLNAFRHQRINDRRPLAREVAAVGSAQRLSASTNQRRGLGWGGLHFVKCCSTPFGINESTTVAALFGELARDQLLNAFRHQRINDVRLGLCLRPNETAQRLSASTNQRLHACPVDLADLALLNAFRHQRINDDSPM